MASKTSASASDSGDSDVGASDSAFGSSGLGGTIRIGATDGSSCSYYAAEDGASCRQPRTCYDCLNVDVDGVDEGCLLSPSGFCEDMTSYKYKADYRRNLTASELRSSGWYNYFPSINSTYCEASDAACVLCDELVANGSSSYNMGWDAGNASTEEYRQFCLGTDGCVCVMACESSDWADNMMADCDNPASSVDSDSTDVSSYTTLLPLFFVLQIMLLGAFVYRRMLLARLLRSQPPAQAEGPYNNVNAISSPSNRLRLSGWRKMQNDLIDKERKQGLFSLRSPRPDATATAAGADYEIASPAILRPSASPAPPTGEVVETSLDDRNSIAVLEERPGANSVASEHQTRNPRNSV